MREVDDAEPQRPTTLLLVYVWDALLALLAILIALAPFSGGLEQNGQSVALPVALQLLLALEAGLYAAAVITVMIFLTRHDRWVRRAQMAVLALPIGLIAISAAARQLIHGDVSQIQLLSSVLVCLLDGLVLYSLTASRVVAWYNRPTPMPMWVKVTVALFLAAGVASLAVQLAL